MTIQAGKKYVLINAKSGTALDVSGTDDVSVHGWEWELHQKGTQWVFRNVQHGKFLGFTSYIPHDSVPLWCGEAQVKWDIRPDEQDKSVYRIFVPGTSFNVDLSDHGDPHNGTIVFIWTKWVGKSQTWRFEEGE